MCDLFVLVCDLLFYCAFLCFSVRPVTAITRGKVHHNFTMSKIQTNPQQTKSKAQDIGLIELKIRSLQLGSKNIPSNFLVCANIFIG